MKSLSTKDFLQQTKALIDDESKWAVGTLARDAKGNPANVDDDTATCFCTLGAVRKLSYNALHDKHNPYSLSNTRNLAVSLLQEQMDDNIPYFNDHNDHDDVMNAFDRAIAKAEALTV